VIVVRPDSLPEGAWKRLRSFADAGGLIIVTPPAQATVHLWTDAMVRDLGLPWAAQREPRALSPAQAIAAERGVAGPRNLLSLLEAELPELAAPVRVVKVLPVEATGTDKGQSTTLLGLSGGLPLALAAAPGAKPAAESGEAEPTGRGLVVMITAALAFEWTDLQAKPLMLPLMQELVRQGVGRARGAFADLAGSTPEAPSRSVELRPITNGESGAVRIVMGRTAEPMRQAGLWRAVDDRGTGRGLLAINADPAGARGDSQPAAAIGTWLSSATGGVEPQWLQGSDQIAAGSSQGGEISSALRSGDDPGKIVLPLLIAALLIALVELVLARWFSHAAAQEGAPA
jgi:hypothetical protein